MGKEAPPLGGKNKISTFWVFTGPWSVNWLPQKQIFLFWLPASYNFINGFGEGYGRNGLHLFYYSNLNKVRSFTCPPPTEFIPNWLSANQFPFYTGNRFSHVVVTSGIG